MPMRRKGFTIIELMLVIGVLVILVGIVVWALKGAGGSAAGNATRSTLQNLTNLSEELNRKNKLAGFEGQPVDSPIYVFLPPPLLGGEFAPGDVTDTSNKNDRRGDAVARTGEVIRRLATLPDNKKALERLPSDQVLQIKLTRSMLPYTDTPGMVVLDGWRNPILFVPATGLHFVSSKQQGATGSGISYAKGARVIAPADQNPNKSLMGIWTAINNTGSPPPGPDWFEGIRSSDGRSFWASAGPDGNFTTGDDNFYSFEQ